MSLTNEVNLGLYRQMAELQEKLRKSEEERMKLEEKFRLLMKSCREEEETRLKNLEDKYAKFLEDCTKRNDRNDNILRSLQKVESGANILFAKSERLKLLKTHYEAYLERVMPQWKQPAAIAYKSSSSIQQSPPIPASFKSSYTSRLTSSSSSDWKYPDVAGGEDTTENDRFFSFMREKPKGKNSCITFPEPVKKEPTPSFKFERKPGVHFEATQPVEEIPEKQDEPIVHIIPEVEKIVLDEYVHPIETKAEIEPPIEKFKEINQEIECLSEKDETERHKRDLEYVLSDEELQPEPYQHQPLESPRSNPIKRELSVGKLAPGITKKFEAPVMYPKSPIRIPHTIVPEEDDVSPITKKSVLEHQKSIDKLKAALSVEEEIENERSEIVDQPQQIPFEEETDVTESSSEVWHQPVNQNDWMQEQQNVIPSDIEEIENQFAEIVNNPQIDEQVPYNIEEPYYQEQQDNPTEIDYNEEQYPESYYEQPQTDYRPSTNLVSNVILEEDENEEQQEEQKPEYDPNNQYQENPEYQEQYQENEQYQQRYQEGEPYQDNNQPFQENEQYQQRYQEGEPYQENNQQFQENEQYQQPYQDNFYDENQQPVYNYDENNQQYDQNYEYQPPEPEQPPQTEYQDYPQEYQQNYDEQQQPPEPEQPQQNEYQDYPQEYQQNYDEHQYQNYDENQTNYQDQPQYDPNYVQEGEYNQNYEQQNQQEYVEYQQEPGENYQPEQGENYQPVESEQGSYQEEPTATQEKQSNLAHLLESDSESYQIEHGGVTGNNEDSDFDFSLSQKQ